MTPASLPVTILLPVFNDWDSASAMLDAIDRVARDTGDAISVVFVDDGSTEPSPRPFGSRPEAVCRVDIVHLRRNVGHQRAIAIGLCWIHGSLPPGLTVVMDADGEDRPEDIPRLLTRCREERERAIVFARRARRTEGPVFRAGYAAFKCCHWLLVGLPVDVGNYSVIPPLLLDRVVGISEIWNHYAAAVVLARLPVVKIPIDRGRRIAGRSHMKFVSLVTHGLSAISVYANVVAVRMLLFSAVLFGAAILGIVAVVAVRLCTTLSIPGWATAAAGLLLVASLNALLLMAVFVQMILQSRNSLPFLPLRDWRFFVASQETLFEARAP